jgi:regulatory protein RepA
VLFAHHVNKTALAQGAEQNQSAARGSSALTDGVRWQCNIAKADKSEDTILLKMTKTNFTKFTPEMKLHKETDGFLTAILEDDTTPSTKPTKRIATTTGSF